MGPCTELNMQLAVSDAYLMPFDTCKFKRLQQLQGCNFCHASIAEQFQHDFAVIVLLVEIEQNIVICQWRADQ